MNINSSHTIVHIRRTRTLDPKYSADAYRYLIIEINSTVFHNNLLTAERSVGLAVWSTVVIHVYNVIYHSGEVISITNCYICVYFTIVVTSI